jgi:uncharacterized protein (DUF433 family)
MAEELRDPVSRLVDATLTLPEASFVTGLSVKAIDREIDAHVLKPRAEPDPDHRRLRSIAGPDAVYLLLVRDLHNELSPRLRRQVCKAVWDAIEEDRAYARLAWLMLPVREAGREVLGKIETLERAKHDLVESRPEVMGGEPVVKGTRVPARMVAELVRQGASKDELRDDFDLTPEQVDAAVLFDRVTPKRGRPRTRREGVTEHVPANR